MSPGSVSGLITMAHQTKTTYKRRFNGPFGDSEQRKKNEWGLIACKFLHYYYFRSLSFERMNATCASGVFVSQTPKVSDTKTLENVY
jgi:hypothetical protein